MALTSGSRFGPYEIVVPLGAGGMGSARCPRAPAEGGGPGGAGWGPREVRAKEPPPLAAGGGGSFGPYEIPRRSAAAGWVRCIAPAIPSSIAMSR